MTTNQLEHKILEKLKDYILDDLSTKLKTMMDKITIKRFEQTNRKVEQMRGQLDTLNGDLEEDRRKLNAIEVSQATTQAELAEIKLLIQRLPKNIGNRMNGKIDEMKEAVGEKVEEAVPKSVQDTFTVTSSKVKVEVKPKRWWQFRHN